MNKKDTKSFEMPELGDFLKAGVQFGHQAKRWNPKMQKHIFTQRGDIHIIDISQTYEYLEKALEFLSDASKRGTVLFVGTKRQAREIVKDSAVDAGAFFVTHRWVGGLLTNFDYIRRSLTKLAKLESIFEKGIEGRTKFEVSRMKKEWERLNRLYSGVKSMDSKPTAVIVLDSKYEKNALREAKTVGVPVVAIVDTNADPDAVNYPIPGNDDAIASIKLFFELFAQAVKKGRVGKGIKHDFKDYSKVEVEIRKSSEDEEQEAKEIDSTTKFEKPIVEKIKPRPRAKKGQGILEGVQKAREEAQTEPKKATKKQATKKQVAKIGERTQKALDQAKISVEKARKMKDAEILAIKGLGKKALEELRA